GGQRVRGGAVGRGHTAAADRWLHRPRHHRGQHGRTAPAGSNAYRTGKEDRSCKSRLQRQEITSTGLLTQSPKIETCAFLAGWPCCPLPSCAFPPPTSPQPPASTSTLWTRRSTR